MEKSFLKHSTTGIRETDFHFKGQTSFYRGKVRDVYGVDDLLVIVSSDRISAFDHVLPKPIPYKGQVLNQLASRFLEESKDIVPNWFLNSPHANVSIGYKCEPIKIEMVIRGYLAGHAWREYKAGKRIICGEKMKDGLRESDKFPEPIITPATKADQGHDEDISKTEILSRGIVSKRAYEILEEYTHKLFQFGSQKAYNQGLILVDTKYEFGIYDGKIMLIDEIHTPDSSRYYYKEGYEQRQKNGEKQKQLSKEFVREWLMENGFRGMDSDVMPEMNDQFVENVSKRYIELYETLTGEKFIKKDFVNVERDIELSLNGYLNDE